ncbi:hypothetical protein X777_12130 [Ooceraea biroi]|uniref:Uncharacterized protein n=1 Tax=Ooceraea biroi TaxID=2015173 RepID=A0A026W0K7_OOCBI|nr:hypothetical protein X777_12130 [Ooceraea biroi]
MTVLNALSSLIVALCTVYNSPSQSLGNVVRFTHDVPFSAERYFEAEQNESF